MPQPVLMRGSVWWMGGCASVRTCDPGNYFNEPLIYARALLYSGGGANELRAKRVLYGCLNHSVKLAIFGSQITGTSGLYLSEYCITLCMSLSFVISSRNQFTKFCLSVDKSISIWSWSSLDLASYIWSQTPKPSGFTYAKSPISGRGWLEVGFGLLRGNISIIT